MPEELAVLILIIWGIIWLFGTISEGVSSASKDYSKQNERKRLDAVKNEQIERFKRKKELAPYVKVFIPKELSKIKEGIALIEYDIQIKPAKLVATEPYWTRQRFIPYFNISKKNTYDEMYVDDIKDILTPNKISWLEIEEELVNSQCKYPDDAPKINQKKFEEEYKQFNTELKEATFEYDKNQVSDIDIENYFSDEKKEVEEYNRLRVEILPTLNAYNEKISDYNNKAKVYFEEYLKDCVLVEKKALVDFNAVCDTYIDECKKQKNYFKKIELGYKNGSKEEVIKRLNYVLSDIKLPDCIPHTWDVDFNSEEKIAIVEIGLPDVVHIPPKKEVELKSGFVDKPLNQSEKKEIVPNIHPAILLRVAYELFRNDKSNTIKLLVLNGWIKFDDPSTGVNTKAYTASLMVEKSQIENINLKKIDPLIAFLNLKGKSAGKLVEIVPVTPVMSLDKKDKRFVATTEVLNKLGSETNLASMDWQDFESLIAELFEKEFAKEGAEVKVTQASRDRGVDAVIFDPDPIRGGKIIVQAKRYANTVDVSAVRDLCAVVKKEGAIKGILVTTSTFGGDAYQFANNEPVTLLNGAELLGLLKKHGYTFRINLAEAKKFNLANNKK